MKIRTALTGLLLSLAVALPVVAGGLRNHQRASAISVADYDCVPTGMFANWSQNRGWTLTFGDSNTTDELDVGLRIDAPSGQIAKTFQIDLNTANGNFPYAEIWAVIPGTTGPQVVGAGPITTAVGPGLTQTTLPNGFIRFGFNAKQYGLPEGTTFSSLYFADGSNGSTPFSDQATNAFLNGIYVPANIQPVPEFDSTLDF